MKMLLELFTARKAGAFLSARRIPHQMLIIF